MYLGWFDDNAKKTPADKIREAIAAYEAKFKTAPTVVLVNHADFDTECWARRNIRVWAKDYIRRNNFWVGMSEPAY